MGALLEGESRISVEEARQRGVDNLLDEARHGHAVVIFGDPLEPVAVMVGADLARSIEDFDDLRSEVHDMLLTFARVMTDTEKRVSFDNVLAALGVTREELAAIDDDE